ncbi:MAG: type II toxin-antitoxin system MqsA family antitoxin [Candidatus Sulfotelmatobacter sp.]
MSDRDHVHLLYLLDKDEQEDLSSDERKALLGLVTEIKQTRRGNQLQMKVNTKKKVKLFADLKQSLSEAIASQQGKKIAVRVSELPPPPKPLTPRQIRAIRQSFNVSQAGFARIINVSLNAVESWEQGVRRPREATLKLLTIADKHPEVLLSIDTL